MHASLCKFQQRDMYTLRRCSKLSPELGSCLRLVSKNWSLTKLIQGTLQCSTHTASYGATSSHYQLDNSNLTNVIRGCKSSSYPNTTQLLFFRRSYKRKFRESTIINNDSEVVLNEFELKNDGSLNTSTFSGLGVTASLCKILSNEGITAPSQVQDRALPATLSSQANCMISSETGSGKTLTFLLPALQEKIVGLTTLIIVPSRELAVQILHQANTLNATTNQNKRIMAYFTGTLDEDTLLQNFAETRPHILIATPKPLLKLLETKASDFANITRLVLDEVDKLLLLPDRKSKMKKRAVRDIHTRATNLIVEKLLRQKRRKTSLQMIATSATLDKEVEEELCEMGWGDHPQIVRVSEIISKNPLISPSTIQHCYLECDNTSECKTREQCDKIDVFLDHFRSTGDKSALVFIHRGAPITQFLYELQKRKIKVEALHENVSESEQYSKFLKAFKNGDIEIVIATEETVRGLDFPWLQTVYILEVPRTASEYLHLCGRVGRVGRCGQAVVVVESPSEKRRLDNHYKKLRVDGEAIIINQ